MTSTKVNLFNKLVEQTYALAEEDSFSKYASPDEFFRKENIFYLEMRLISSIQMYRLKFGENFIDFPINWGGFASLCKEQVYIQIEDECLKSVISLKLGNHGSDFSLVNLGGRCFYLNCSPEKTLKINEFISNFDRLIKKLSLKGVA